MHRKRGEHGFTIVETLAALTVFSLITIGVVPMLGQSMRALGASRGRTVAENVARAAVERLQGIKYYVSWDAKAKRVDLLDYYLPQTTGAFPPGQSYSTSAPNPPLTAPASGGTGVFTTVCPPPAGTTNGACPSGIPEGQTLTFTASFVEPVTGTTPQTYRVVNPTTSYSARPATVGTCQAAPCSDKPPADLIDIKVSVSWPYGGSTETFELRSLVGERTFSSGAVSDAVPAPGASPPPGSVPSSGSVRMQGAATLDYGLRIDTGFSLTTATFPAACATEPCRHSELIYTLGMSDARIETKDTSTADVMTRYAEGRVVRTYPAGTTPPASPPPDLTYVTGATSFLHAPPTTTYAIHDQKTTITDVPNPDQPSALQGRIYQNENHDMKVDVSGELPQAEGNFRSAAGATNTLEWYMNNTMRDPRTDRGNRFDSATPIVHGIRYSAVSGQPNTVRGFTKANTGALSASDRGVRTAASIDLPWTYVLPELYAGKNGASSYPPLAFWDFAADVNCNSTANPTTAAATASWSVSLQYYVDTNNDGSTRGLVPRYATINSNGPDVLHGATVPDALAALKQENPLVFDGSAGCCGELSDVYLFDVRTGASSTWKRGYLTDWASNKNLETSKSADGRVTSASINGALRIETSSLRETYAPDVPATAVSLSFGKLSCNAVDNR